MTSHATKKNPGWLNLAKRLQAYNETIQLALDEERMGGEPCDGAPLDPESGWPVRLLALEDDQLVIEKPSAQLTGGAGGAGSELRRGLPLKVLVSQNGERWYISTEIADKKIHQLRADMGVSALVLAPPLDVRNAQRRSSYRIQFLESFGPTITLEPIPVDISEVNEFEEDVDKCFAPFTGCLLDISAGGVAIKVREKTKCHDRFNEYRCKIVLALNEANGLEFPPNSTGEPESLHLQMQLKRVTPDGHMTLIVDHDHYSQKEVSDLEDKIMHFMAWCQRQQLKKQRGRK